MLVNLAKTIDFLDSLESNLFLSNVFVLNNNFCINLKFFKLFEKYNILNILSGGPLLCMKNNRWTVYGITSFGEGCGRQGKYGIYAKVPNYTDWLERTIETEEKNRGK